MWELRVEPTVRTCRHAAAVTSGEAHELPWLAFSSYYVVIHPPLDFVRRFFFVSHSTTPTMFFMKLDTQHVMLLK